MTPADLDYLRTTVLYRPAKQPSARAPSTRWAEPIRQLLIWGYSFHPLKFSAGDLLFRATPLAPASGAPLHGHRSDDIPAETAAVESAMGVCFLTHELSDALSLIQAESMARISAIESDHFNRQVTNGRAATLAIGDAGMVFRYPFVCDPLPEPAICARFRLGVPGRAEPPPEPGEFLISGDSPEQRRRAIERQLADLGRRPARVLAPDRAAMPD